MLRRHFVKISATTLAATLISKLTYAAEGQNIINVPDEVWVQTAAGWLRLTTHGNSSYSFNDVEKPLNAELAV